MYNPVSQADWSELPLCEETHDQELRRKRVEAAEKLSELEIEDVPAPYTLAKQLEETYDLSPSSVDSANSP